MTKADVEAAIQSALELHQAGDLLKAEAIYRSVLQSDPSNPDALHLLGVIAYQTGDNDRAAELIRQAIAENPAVPDFHNNLGNALRLLGKLDESVLSFRRALKLAPQFVEAHNNLGLAFRDQGRTDDAIRCFRKALKLQPELPELHNSLGLTLLDKSRNQEAAECFRRALELRAGYAEAHNNLGLALKAEGRTDAALLEYQEALRLNPGLAETHNNLGTWYRDQDRKDDALSCYREALRLSPDMVEANLNLGAMLHDHGYLQEARERYSAVLARKPDQITALWGRCIAQLEILYDRAEDVGAGRARYRSLLEEYIGAVRLDTPSGIEAAAKVAGEAQPFYLAYQGEVDRDLQDLYGTFLCTVLAARHPQWSKRPAMPPAVPGEPLRIGIVSGFFRYHSNWKIPIKGWVENLDRRRFSLFAYHTGRRKDGETEIARRSFERFVEDVPRIEELCRQILADRLHVLIYPEIGMDSRTAQLAALRLAPVQCVSWGHPDTSGFPTMDYYLSSDLMEPPDADSHYTEKLVRLPNLSIFYTPPVIQPAGEDRRAFGLRPGATVYFCAQSLSKYLPQHDEVFPSIGLEAGDCQFVFLHYANCRQVGERFLERLKKAFFLRGIRAEDFVVLLPPQDPPHYQALNRIADVFLDSIGWSGCNSTLEAAGYGLPIVALPGKLMRGRHSLAILTMMGVRETIADSIEEYVRIAVRLARDADWRNRMSQTTKENAGRAYSDMESVRGLERFLEDAVAAHACARGRR